VSSKIKGSEKKCKKHSFWTIREIIFQNLLLPRTDKKGMDIVSLQPQQRLSQTEFEPIENQDEAGRSFSRYTCAICKQEVTLTLADLIKNRRSTTSGPGVGSFYRALFDCSTSPQEKEHLESRDSKKKENKIFHYDFHCPGCHQPVRIEYAIHPASPQPSSSSSSGRSLVRLMRVWEIVLPKFPSTEELLGRMRQVIEVFYSLSLGHSASAFPTLWLVALILSPLPSDSLEDIVSIFFQEKPKLDSIIGWSFAWEWIDEQQASLVREQFSVWLAMILKFNHATESAAVSMLKTADLLQNLGLAKKPETLALALALTLTGCSEEKICSCIRDVARLKKSERFCLTRSDPAWDALLMMVLADNSWSLRQIRPISRILERRNYLLSERDRRLASLLLCLQGRQNPQGCVERFTELAEAFSHALAKQEESLVDPAFFPASGHPFQNIVLSFLNEFSPAFPFDSCCFLPVALLAASSWEAEDLARESIGLYHYLRSYRKFINPALSFWLSTWLVFSAWEGGICPNVLLFWFMASVIAAPTFQFQEEPSLLIPFHRG